MRIVFTIALLILLTGASMLSGRVRLASFEIREEGRDLCGDVASGG